MLYSKQKRRKDIRYKNKNKKIWHTPATPCSHRSWLKFCGFSSDATLEQKHSALLRNKDSVLII